MRRTELIPQTTAAINSGTVYYHFSISQSPQIPLLEPSVDASAEKPMPPLPHDIVP